MSDFRKVLGFEEKPASAMPGRLGRDVISPPTVRAPRPMTSRSLLVKVVTRTPEAVVVFTGRPRGPGPLLTHLNYITRKGELELEDQDGFRLKGKEALRELADDWAAAARGCNRTRPNAALACSMVFSGPEGASASGVMAATRDLARTVFAPRFEYGLVLHTDTENPHVHVTVRALGHDGRRLNPPLSEAQRWRALYARILCEHGIEAIATPCRLRGVTPRREPIGLRKLREKHALGRSPAARVDVSAYREAAQAAFLGEGAARPSEARLAERQAKVRAGYEAKARTLAGSVDPDDRALAAQIDRFLSEMPPAQSRRQALARQLLMLNEELKRQTKARETARTPPERTR